MEVRRPRGPLRCTGWLPRSQRGAVNELMTRYIDRIYEIDED